LTSYFGHVKFLFRLKQRIEFAPLHFNTSAFGPTTA
jgi:hypothetical protein